MKPEEIKHGEEYSITTQFGNIYHLIFDKIERGTIYHKGAKLVVKGRTNTDEAGKEFKPSIIMDVSNVIEITPLAKGAVDIYSFPHYQIY